MMSHYTALNHLLVKGNIVGVCVCVMHNSNYKKYRTDKINFLKSSLCDILIVPENSNCNLGTVYFWKSIHLYQGNEKQTLYDNIIKVYHCSSSF
jgi:hypothetical protein